MLLSLRTAQPLGPIVSPEDAATREYSAQERMLLEQMPGTQIIGTVDDAVARLEALVAETGADELMLTGTTYDVESRIATIERIAAAW